MPFYQSVAAIDEAIAQIQSTIPGLRDEAVRMAADKATPMDKVRAAKAAYQDASDRLGMLQEERARMADEAAFKLRKDSNGVLDKAQAAGMFYRAALTGGNTRALPRMVYEQLGAIPAGSEDQGNGSVLIPDTMGQELLMAPRTINRLRGVMSVTQVPNLILPRLGFEQDDDAFVAKDGESAKELKLRGDQVRFGTHEYRVRASVAESVLRTTPVNIQAAVDEGLASAGAKKELKMIFGTDLPADVKHMSLYQKGSDGQEVIKGVSGSDMFTAWCAAFADLEDDYREQASGVMRFSDYVKMLRAIAPNESLFNAKPESVLGVPMTFTEYATTPVVGAFRYLHLNFACAPWADVEKVPSQGLRRFYLNSLYDIQVKMASAFRRVVVGA